MLAMIAILSQRKVWPSRLYSARALGERTSPQDIPSPMNSRILFPAYVPTTAAKVMSVLGNKKALLNNRQIIESLCARIITVVWMFLD